MKLSVLAAAFIVPLALWASPDQTIQPDDWPQLQKDASHSGYTEYAVNPPYEILWKWWEAPLSQRVQPVIAYDTVYAPSLDGHIYALHSRTGKVRWKTPCSKPITGGFVHSAAVADGLVVAASLDKYVYALDAFTGEIRWKFETGGRIRSAPTIAYDTVYIGSPDGYFYAIDLKTGEKRWDQPIGAPVLDTAAVADGRVFFGAENVKGYALDARTGNILWSRQMYGQGIRDRWTVAAAGKVVFTTMPLAGEHTYLHEGTMLIRTNWNRGWAGQREAIENYFKDKPYRRVFYVFDAARGHEPYVAPVLYTGGSQSAHPQVVINDQNEAFVIFRTSEVGGFETWGATTQYGLYLGRMDLETGDIERLDSWGRTPPADHDPEKPFAQDRSTKAPIICDESFSLSMGGDDLHVAGSGRYRFMMDLPTRAFHGIINTEGDRGSARFTDRKVFDFTLKGSWVNPQMIWNIKNNPDQRFDTLRRQLTEQGVDYSVWPTPMADVTGDGNDRQRPQAIADDLIVFQKISIICAVKGVRDE